MEGTKPRTGEGIAGGRGSGPGPLRSLLWKAPARLPDERYSLSSPCPQTRLVTQEQRARFTPVTKSSGASQHQITTRKRPEALWSPRFGDNASSGLTSEPQVPTSQTKHADCQPKQTSLLTTRFCLDDFPLKQKTTKRALSSTECAPLFVRSRESHGT